MSWDAQAWASLTGIAAGWLQHTEMPTYVVGCEKCGIFFRRVVPDHEIKWWPDKPVEDIIQGMVWKSFEDFARKHNCPHVNSYLVRRQNPEECKIAQNLVLVLALLNYVKMESSDSKEEWSARCCGWGNEMLYYLITVSEWGGIQELDESKLREFADKGYLDYLVSLDGREKIHDTFTLYDDDHLLIRGEMICALDKETIMNHPDRVEISHAMSRGGDDHYDEYFRCPNCGCRDLVRDFSYCPGCGVPIFFVEED